MGRINHLGEPARRDKRHIDRLERGDNLGWSSVRRGQTQFNGNESLKVNGSAVITGWLIVTGVLKLVGTLLLEGVINLTGVMTVVTGGKIKVGTVELGITSNGRPGLDFNGATLTENADRLAMESGSAVIGVAPEFSAVAFGSNSVVVNNTTTTITGPIKAASLTAAPGGTTLYTVVADATGRLYRVAGVVSA